jgi:hypothetical protein
VANVSHGCYESIRDATEPPKFAPFPADFSWERMTKMANDFLRQPKILHPWPSVRFAVTHPGYEGYAVIGPVRIWRGALGNLRP